MKFSSVFIGKAHASANFLNYHLGIIAAWPLAPQNLFAAPHRRKPYTGVSIRNIVSLHSPFVVVVERVVFPFYRVSPVSPPPRFGQTLSKKLCDDGNQLVGRNQIIGRIVPCTILSSTFRKHHYHFLESCRSMLLHNACKNVRTWPTIETSLSSDLFLLSNNKQRANIYSPRICSYFISYLSTGSRVAHSVELNGSRRLLTFANKSNLYSPVLSRASPSKWGNWFGPRGFSGNGEGNGDAEFEATRYTARSQNSRLTQASGRNEKGQHAIRRSLPV